jgi:hypothetical protein
MTTSEIAALWSAIGQIAAAVLAIVAVCVTAYIAMVDRRRADRRAELDRQLAREAEERRWERELLIRLSVTLEASASSEEGRAVILALGPSRLPASCFPLLGDAVEQADVLDVPPAGMSEWDRARIEVAHALRDGLPPRRVPAPSTALASGGGTGQG